MLAVELGLEPDDLPSELMALDGQPKDGAMIMSLHGTILGATGKLRHGDSCAYELIKPDGKKAGTRHAAGLGAADFMAELWRQSGNVRAPGVVLVSSDAGGVSVMLPCRDGLPEV